MEIYQWLLRRNGLPVSDTGYFVCCTGRPDAEAFDAKIDFDIRLIRYEGSDAWVGGTVEELYRCLNKDEIPSASDYFDCCKYVAKVSQVRAGIEP